MEQSTFVKMAKSEKPLIGKPQIIICGFKPKEQELFIKIIKKCYIEAPTLFPTDKELTTSLAELNSRPSGEGRGKRSAMQSAIILAGITEKQFHRIIDRTKKSSLPRPLWATLTETSQTWPLSKLLNELSRERAVMG